MTVSRVSAGDTHEDAWPDGWQPGGVAADQVKQASLPAGTWFSTYVRGVAAADAVSAAVGGVVGYLVRFGPSPVSSFRLGSSMWLALVFPAVWVAAMLIARNYEQRFLWTGSQEFRRVAMAFLVLLAGVATVSWAFELALTRGFVVLALPLTAGLTLLHRGLQRRWLQNQRRRGRFQWTTVVVGHRAAVTAFCDHMKRESSHGFAVIGCCVPPAAVVDGAVTDDVPILGGLQDVADVVERFSVDAVTVLPCPELDASSLRDMTWQLERTSAQLFFAPAMLEVVSPRIQIMPVAGLPLMHIERPELRGVRRAAKEIFDRGLAALMLLSVLPLLMALGLAIRVTSRGPVFFRQARVGRGGRAFPMLKFRTMVDGADKMHQALAVAGNHDGNGVLFKLRNDPRVTRVGRLMRRYSLDELPQLFNILRGEMSLVGPRPPLPSETALYGIDMRRRFLVKPGITGLWQVSGRSDLSWDESVRIDVAYVENWSLAFDLKILWRTIGAVVRASGAY
jgi:exopolysaccharide biosynthesis polyprenyl glycosylphosphotransferase